MQPSQNHLGQSLAMAVVTILAGLGVVGLAALF